MNGREREITLGVKDRMMEDGTLSGVESTPKELTHGRSSGKDVKRK